MWAAGIKSLIPDCQQCPRHIVKPTSRAFAVADVGSLKNLRPLTKELEVVDLGCVSNPSLSRWQQLIEGVEEVTWLFGIANKLS